MSVRNIESELARFEDFFHTIAPQFFAVSRLEDHVFCLAPKSGGTTPRTKQFGFTVMGLTHGNEVAGVAVVNDVLAFLAGRPSIVDMPMAFALGNPWAARASRRFIERDLNRSFGRASRAMLEEKRAHALAAILGETAYFIDLHQTTEPCETAFFIFPYTEQAYRFARSAEPRLPVVPHWGDPFSAEGRCTDEYTLANGGIGITVELGQNGFGAYHVAAGFKTVLQGMTAASAALSGSPWPEPTGAAEIYTWAKIYPWPEAEVSLDEGWYNFKSVTKGQRLGRIGGREFFAECDGRVLFPKYVRGPELQKPTELIRIMRTIDARDLGT